MTATYGLYKALKQDSGFTVDSDLRPYTGKGYAVSVPDCETRIPEGLLNADILDALLTAYISDCQTSAAWTAPSRELYIGGWLSDGVFYLDLSEIVATVKEAVMLAYERSQQAYYDFGKGESVRPFGGPGDWRDEEVPQYYS